MDKRKNPYEQECYLTSFSYLMKMSVLPGKISWMPQSPDTSGTE